MASTRKARGKTSKSRGGGTASAFVCPDCGFEARHAMGLGRHRSARHGAISKRSQRRPAVPATPGWLGRKDAAARAGVHYNTIRLWEQAGLIRTQRGAGIRGAQLNAADLDRVLAERGAGAAAAPAGGDGSSVAALERRFEQLLDGLERIVASARTGAAPKRRPGRPLGSKNRPKQAAAASVEAKKPTRSRKTTGRKRTASKRAAPRRAAPRRAAAKRPAAKRAPKRGASKRSTKRTTARKRTARR